VGAVWLRLQQTTCAATGTTGTYSGSVVSELEDSPVQRKNVELYTQLEGADGNVAVRVRVRVLLHMRASC
jgi:hypothetical protein